MAVSCYPFRLCTSDAGDVDGWIAKSVVDAALPLGRIVGIIPLPSGGETCVVVNKTVQAERMPTVTSIRDPNTNDCNECAEQL